MCPAATDRDVSHDTVDAFRDPLRGPPVRCLGQHMEGRGDVRLQSLRETTGNRPTSAVPSNRYLSNTEEASLGPRERARTAGR